MEPVEAILSWSLDVECPHCKEEFDIGDIDADHDHLFAHAIFNNAWDDVNGTKIDCLKCGKEFTVDKAEGKI